MELVVLGVVAGLVVWLIYNQQKQQVAQERRRDFDLLDRPTEQARRNRIDLLPVVRDRRQIVEDALEPVDPKTGQVLDDEQLRDRFVFVADVEPAHELALAFTPYLRKIRLRPKKGRMVMENVAGDEVGYVVAGTPGSTSDQTRSGYILYTVPGRIGTSRP